MDESGVGVYLWGEGGVHLGSYRWSPMIVCVAAPERGWVCMGGGGYHLRL